MKKIIYISAIFLIVNVFVGCAVAPPPRPQPMHISNSRALDKPFDIVWTQLIEYLSSRQIQLKTINKDSGFLDTEFMFLPTQIVADYAWTGKRLPSFLHDRGRIKANIFVKKISDSQTSVTINAWVQVFETFPSPGRWFDAKSSGRFESDILGSL